MPGTKTVLLIAIVATVALGACRREVPHPNGLGAGDLIQQQQIKEAR